MNDITNDYELPTIEMVGGGTIELRFNVFDESTSEPQILTGASANFAISDYANRTINVVSKQMTVSRDDSGINDNVLVVDLSPTDTYKLDGKYIYQIHIKDSTNNYEPPKQGLMYIARNINPAFVTAQNSQ